MPTPIPSDRIKVQRTATQHPRLQHFYIHVFYFVSSSEGSSIKTYDLIPGNF